MIDFLHSGQVGNIELNEQRKMRNLISERWDKIGMTEGLSGIIKENTAMLFENEANYLLKESTASDNSGQFQTVVFPIIRRVFSKLLANDIVSVQAMNLPVGKLFFMLPVTSERKWEDAAGNEVTDFKLEDGMTGSHNGIMGYERTDRKNGNRYNRFYLPDEAVNAVTPTFVAKDEEGKNVVLDAENYKKAIAEAAEKGLVEGTIKQVQPTVTKYMGKTLYDLFYNDFLFDNSKGKITIKKGEVEAYGFVNGRLVALDGDDSKLVKYADDTVRNVIVKVTGFSSYGAGRLIGPDGNEMDTEAFLASLKLVYREKNDDGDEVGVKAYPFRVVTQKYGKGIVEYADVCDATGAIYLDVDLSSPVAVGEGDKGKFDGYVGLEAKEALTLAESLEAYWSQYDSLELETEIGEVSFKLDSVTVSVEPRKLRATWSPELAQDVNAFHNIDAEAELTALLSEQIAAEIDREILRDLRVAAPWQLRFDVNGWRRINGFSTNYTQKDWNQELITKVNQISAQIHKATLRGGANFVVVSSEISAVLDNLEYFHVSDASAESDQYNMGIERVGSLQGRYQVYRDPYSPAWSMIIGHKGKSLLDTGYIYAPYIPMQLTPTVINPENFAPVKGIMTRYAKKCVNNRFYGGVRVDGLVQWSVDELR